MNTVNTKNAPRREVRYASLDELRSDLDRLVSAGEGGTVTTGNWSAGEIFWHVGRLIDMSIDGFPGGPPAIVRFFMKLFFRRKALETDQPMPSGIKLPNQASYLLPPEGTSFEDGANALRAALDRVARGERMEQPSPVFGPMTHENWTTIHRKHAALHMSYVDTR